jgi:uroporphyrinogen decarboxylase
MLPRERVLLALSHKTTDRVPLDFWGTPETREKLRLHFGTKDDEDVLKALDIDIRQFQPAYKGVIETKPDGSYIDEMGVHRKPVKNEFCVYEEYAAYPLAFVESVEDFENYKWPDIDNFDFESLPEQIGDAHKTYYIKLQTGGLFELAWALRGYEQFLIDMVEAPEIVHFIMSRLTDFYCEYVRRAMRYAGAKYDMVYTYDDIAAQNTLLMSKDMWREFIRPYHAKLNGVIHDLGKTVMYHSCGAVYDMIPLLAELPIDVLNPIQPAAAGMDFERIKGNFGSALCFHGGIDIQHLLPRGSVEDVRSAVRRAIWTLGKGGGYIMTSAHYIQADTPVENILAMYETAKNTMMQE